MLRINDTLVEVTRKYIWPGIRLEEKSDTRLKNAEAWVCSMEELQEKRL